MNRKKRRTAERGERADLRERLCRRLDLPPDCLPGVGLVELRGQNSMTVKGCGKILTYTPELIRIGLKKGVLCVRGRRLCCTSYYVGAVGVDGWICGVSFEEE
ncbi:MAG: YabP/YqfC family sporulation protein [Clostridia bacterium]|nr:YabP/YqfC family sporulation protein [Clostridia bacterium]